eukprot:TRINITY_DN508_c0_g1_i5.p1 TRINITY_DN508_c0_g1~~TRINITY_DN508_c0_g1_i5.p1  ORF type:complete len:487 (-),score=114.06 TRINITY_DN508_c0_g1_i5:2258-3718(-)
MSSLSTSRGPLSLSTERERGSTLRKATKDRAVTDIRADYQKTGAPLPSIEFLQELQKRTKAIRVLQLDYESSSDEEDENDENVPVDDEQNRLMEQFQKQLSSTQTHLAAKKSKRELEKEKKQQKKEAKKEEKKKERERRKEKRKNGGLWGSLSSAFSSKDKHQKEESTTKSRSPSVARASPSPCASPPSGASQTSTPQKPQSPSSSRGSSRGGSYIGSQSSRPLTQTEIVQTIKKLHALNNQMGTIKKKRREQAGSSIEPSPNVPLEEQFYPVQRRKSESAIVIQTEKKNISPLSSEIKPNPLKTSTDSATKKHHRRPPSLVTTSSSPTVPRRSDNSKVSATSSDSKVLSVPSDDFKETPLSDVPSPPSVTSSEDVETISPLCSSPASNIVRDAEDAMEDLEMAAEITLSDAKQLLEQLKSVPNLAEQLQNLSTQGQLPDFEGNMLDDLRCDIESLSGFDQMDDSRDLAALGLNLDLGLQKMFLIT